MIREDSQWDKDVRYRGQAGVNWMMDRATVSGKTVHVVRDDEGFFVGHIHAEDGAETPVIYAQWDQHLSDACLGAGAVAVRYEPEARLQDVASASRRIK